MQCSSVFQFQRNPLFYSNISHSSPGTSFRIKVSIMNVGWPYQYTSPSLPPILRSSCYSPWRDFFLDEAIIWLTFLTFVSGFDSETFGSTCVQCPRSTLLTMWFSWHFFLCFYITLLMLRLSPMFEEGRLAVIQPFVLLFPAHDFSGTFETRMHFYIFSFHLCLFGFLANIKANKSDPPLQTHLLSRTCKPTSLWCFTIELAPT